jgi:hypothetical protein
VCFQLSLGEVSLGVEVDVAVLLGLLCGEPSAKLLSSRFEFSSVASFAPSCSRTRSKTSPGSSGNRRPSDHTVPPTSLRSR